MRSFFINESKNGVIKASAYGGVEVSAVIADAIKYLSINTELKKIVITNFNGVDIVIDEKSTLESALKNWESAWYEKRKEAEKKEAEWLRSPEGIAETKRLEQKRLEHEAFVYHSVDEALLDLTSVNPCDLSSDKTTSAQALDFCQKVMTILSKCIDLNFTDKQVIETSELLKTLGARGHAEINEKFVSGEKNPEALITAKGNIEFPSNVFNQLIDTRTSSFNFAIYWASGDIHRWLKAQKAKTKDKI